MTSTTKCFVILNSTKSFFHHSALLMYFGHSGSFLPVVLPPGTYLHPSPQTPHQHGTSNHMEKVGCTQDKLSLTFTLEMFFCDIVLAKAAGNFNIVPVPGSLHQWFCLLGHISPYHGKSWGTHQIYPRQVVSNIQFGESCFCNFQLHKMFAKEYDEKSISYIFVRIKKPRLIFDRDVAASRYFVFGVKIFVRMGPD